MGGTEAVHCCNRGRGGVDALLHGCINQGDANDFITPGNVIHTIS